MPLHRPRRIFRSEPLRLSRRGGRGPHLGPAGRSGFGARLRRAVLLGLLVAAGTGAVVLIPLPADLFGRVPNPSGRVVADSTQVAVVDGQTLRLHQLVVRLRDIEAPARGAICHAATGAPYDCGAAAAQSLAVLVRDRTVACDLGGRDARGFTQARCTAGDAPLNEAQVAAGFARAQDGDPTLTAAQDAARLARRGLWNDAGGARF